MTTTDTTTACPSWCVCDVEMVGDGIWHHAAPVTVQLSRDSGGRQVGPPAVLELELTFLQLDEPVSPDEHSTPEITVRGDDGSGSIVWLCLAADDIAAVTAEMLRLAEAARDTERQK